MNFNTINQLDALSRSNQLGIITRGVARGTSLERRRIEDTPNIANLGRVSLPIINVNGPGVVAKRKLLLLNKWTLKAFTKSVNFARENSKELILILITLLLSKLIK